MCEKSPEWEEVMSLTNLTEDEESIQDKAVAKYTASSIYENLGSIFTTIRPKDESLVDMTKSGKLCQFILARAQLNKSRVMKLSRIQENQIPATMGRIYAKLGDLFIEIQRSLGTSGQWSEAENRVLHQACSDQLVYYAPPARPSTITSWKQILTRVGDITKTLESLLLEMEKVAVTCFSRIELQKSPYQPPPAPNIHLTDTERILVPGTFKKPEIILHRSQTIGKEELRKFDTQFGYILINLHFCMSLVSIQSSVAKFQLCKLEL